MVITYIHRGGVVGIQKREVEYTKEIDDVAVLLVNIVKAARAKKSAGEIAAGEVQDLLNALQNVDDVDDELKANRKVALQTIGYRSGELTDAILGESKSAGGSNAGGSSGGSDQGGEPV